MFLNENIILEFSSFLDRESLKYFSILDNDIEDKYNKNVKRTLMLNIVNGTVDYVARSKELFESITSNIKDGKYFKTYNPFLKRIITSYKNNLIHGKYIEYLRGDLENVSFIPSTFSEESISNFISASNRGRAEGNLKSLLLLEVDYVNGKKEGVETDYFYSYTGNINIIEININGDKKRFYAFNKYKITEYKDGMLDGKALTFFNNGVLEKEETYKLDKLNGVSIKYQTNGNKDEIEEYLLGILIREEFYSNNEKYMEVKYKYRGNGEISEIIKILFDKTIISYYGKNLKDIKSQATILIKDGNKIKLLSIYNNNKIIKTRSYKNDLLDGEAIDYYESGDIKVHANYVNNELKGEYIKYDRAGNKILDIIV